MRILITNSVPLNGGDEALLRATIEALAARWPASEVAVLCKDAELSRKQLPDVVLESDLEFVRDGADRRVVSELYRRADVVVSAPGGFLNDYYPIEERLRGLEVALALGKPVVIFAQSIGPFWRAASRRRAAEVLNRVSRICVRDHASSACLLECGIAPAKIIETADAAFLWHGLAPELCRPKDGPINTIGLCFRVWPLGDEELVHRTIAKAQGLCRHVLANPQRDIVFLSTCQGVPGYVDDSELAARIVTGLPREAAERCRIDRKRYPPRELIDALGRCDAFVGMRLHACVLGMLAGTPAMGLGYEQKTEEIFRQLGLESYQVGFDEDEGAWLRCAGRFFDDAAEIRRALPAALDRACRRAGVNLDAIAECVSARSGEAPTDDDDDGRAKPEWTGLVGKYDVPHLRLRQVAALVSRLEIREVVDLGCGRGRLRQLCPDLEYVGCDFVRPAGGVDFPFYQCDFNREELPADLQDLEAVVCSGILEYVEDVPRFLAQLRARVRRDGYLIATYFNMNHISRIAALVRGRTLPVRPDWRGFHSPASIMECLAGAGFRITDRIAVSHGLRTAPPVEQTVSVPLKLPRARAWSPLLAHQFIFVARCGTAPGVTGLASEIDAVVPSGEGVILVDDEEWGSERAAFGQRRLIPFLERDGQYWGRPPDDETAIRELERLLRAGVGFIAFASPAFWWLDHYAGLHAYLRSRCRCLLRNDRLIVFDLRREVEGPAGPRRGSWSTGPS